MSSLLETLQTQARLASSSAGQLAEDLHAFFDIMEIAAGQVDERVLAWVQTQNALIYDATAAWQWMLENSDQVVAGYLISIPGAVGEPGNFDETTGAAGTIATATTDLPDLGSGFQWGIFAGSDARIGVVSTATGQGNTMGITTSSAIYSGDSADFTVTVTNGDKTIVLSENQSTYIPLGQVHRLANPGKVPLEIIEVQSGSYLGEDDIVRFEDTYGRS